MQKSPKSEKFVANFEKMFDNEFLSDLELKTNDGMILKTHKSILAARSPVFYAKLNNDMKESKENVINVPDFDSVVMKEVLRFIYCQQYEGFNKEMVYQMIHAADMYQIDDLKEACVKQIIFALSSKNVLKSLAIADKLSDTHHLFDDCIDVIIRYI